MKTLKTIGTTLFVVFLIALAIHCYKETADDDLRKYHGYKIEELYISRMSSKVTIVGPNNDTIKKLFDNEEVEEIVKGLIIK